MTFQRSSASECERQCSPTKFEAARSRFFVGRDGVSHREMQKCASPFVEVRQIEFLARETPNYIATNLHTYPINGHASVSGSHLRKRSDEENPQRCYDPSDDRDGTAGVPSTQPVLVREPTSAFSVRWGGSYCPLCSTPRNRGRSAPRKAPSYLSPNQGIDPLT